MSEFATFDVVTTTIQPILSLFGARDTVSVSPRSVRTSEVLSYESVASYEHTGGPHACLKLRNGEVLYVKQHVTTVAERLSPN